MNNENGILFTKKDLKWLEKQMRPSKKEKKLMKKKQKREAIKTDVEIGATVLTAAALVASSVCIIMHNHHDDDETLKSYNL